MIMQSSTVKFHVLYFYYLLACEYGNDPRFCITFQVSLVKGWGNSDTDGRSYFWNVLPLKRVVTNNVKITASSAYSTKENGFIEIQMLAGIFFIFPSIIVYCLKQQMTTRSISGP